VVPQAVAIKQQHVCGPEPQPLQVLPSDPAACSRKPELATAATGSSGGSSPAGRCWLCTLCWVQQHVLGAAHAVPTVGGPMSHPIVLDANDEGEWVWAEMAGA
jgi:hypothetical protein